MTPGGWSRRHPTRLCACPWPYRSILPGREQIDAAAGRVDRPHPHADRIAQPDRTTGSGPDEDRALLVELPPVAAQPAYGQQALELALGPERHERPGAGQPHDLPLEHRFIGIEL